MAELAATNGLGEQPGGAGRPSVLHVCQPRDGGVPAVVKSLALEQRDSGLAVSVACRRSSDLWEFSSHTSGIQAYSWNAHRAPGPSTILEALELRRIVRKVDPDILHLHSAKAGLAGRLFRTSSHTKIVYQPHAWPFQAVDSRFARLGALWERGAAARTSTILCVSSDERELGKVHDIRGRFAVVANGIDLNDYPPLSRSEGLSRTGLGPGRIVLCVGRVCRQKGQDILLSQWQHIQASVPDARLVLVGDGPTAEPLRRQFPDVDWAGSRCNVADYYAAADVVVAPSRWEAMALVPIEAMAMNRAVVGFGVQGIEESLGDCGLSVAPDDPGALSDAIVQLLLDDSLRERLESQSRARVELFFDRKKNASEVRALYQEVMEEADR